MKKALVLIISILLVCTIFLTACGGLGYTNPSFDKFDLTGNSGTGVSGTPVLSFDAMVSDNSNPLPLKDASFVESNEVVWKPEYFTTTLSIEEDNGKMVDRRMTRTYVYTADYDFENREDFVYVSKAMPVEIYEVDYLYDCKQVSNRPNFDNPTRPYDFVATKTDWINAKIFDFIRYVYLQTNGKVNLTFTYDTSFNYRTNEVGGGIVIRGKLAVKESTLTASVTMDDLLNASIGQSTLLEIFNSTGHKLDMRFVSTLNLTTGESTWCDVQIGVPGITTDATDLWAYMLYYYNQI